MNYKIKNYFYIYCKIIGIMIKCFKEYTMNENISNFDLTKLLTIVSINKDDEGNWIYVDNNHKDYFLPKDKIGIITKIDDNFAKYVNSGHPITKYFELDGNTIIYAANFAVDGVILRDGHVYLIERSKANSDNGKVWALPGGFIDGGETARQAVLREMQEETDLKLEDIISIEPMEIVKCNDPRENNFYTYPFLIKVKSDTKLVAGDDAKRGKWLLINRAIKNNDMAFTHHTEILKKVYF